MPLTRDLTSRIGRHDPKRAIGFWMTVAGSKPAKPVRVFVTYEALSGLNPSNVRDMHGASENFERFRLKVEKAANNSFAVSSISCESTLAFGFFGLRRNAMTPEFPIISRASCRLLGTNWTEKTLIHVRLPPGCLMLATRPVSTGCPVQSSKA